jgi:hypothetical protein
MPPTGKRHSSASTARSRIRGFPPESRPQAQECAHLTVMLPRKHVAATAVTITSSGQAGARISPKIQNQCNPKRPPTSHHQTRRSSPTSNPCRRPLCTTRPSTPHAAHGHNRNEPSRSPQCRNEALATGQTESPSTRPKQSRPHRRPEPPLQRSGTNSQRTGELPQRARGRRPPLPRTRPAKPIGPEQQPPCLHAAQHRTTPRRPSRRADRHPLPRRAPPEQPPRQAPLPPTWGRRRQMASSATPPRPEAPGPFEDEARCHRGKGRRRWRQGEGRRRAGGGGG